MNEEILKEKEGKGKGGREGKGREGEEFRNLEMKKEGLRIKRITTR